MSFSSDGGVNYGYTITGGDLPQATTVNLYWASGTTVATEIGSPIASTTTLTAQGITAERAGLEASILRRRGQSTSSSSQIPTTRSLRGPEQGPGPGFSRDRGDTPVVRLRRQPRLRLHDLERRPPRGHDRRPLLGGRDDPGHGNRQPLRHHNDRDGAGNVSARGSTTRFWHSTGGSKIHPRRCRSRWRAPTERKPRRRAIHRAP